MKQEVMVKRSLSGDLRGPVIAAIEVPDIRLDENGSTYSRPRRQVAQEHLSGDTLHSSAKHHDGIRKPIDAAASHMALCNLAAC